MLESFHMSDENDKINSSNSSDIDEHNILDLVVG